MRKLVGSRVFGIACSGPDSNNILASFFLILLLIEGHDLLVELQNLLILVLLGHLIIFENIGGHLFLLLLLVGSLLKNIGGCITPSGYTGIVFFVQNLRHARLEFIIICFLAFIHCQLIPIFLVVKFLTKVSEFMAISFQPLGLRNI